MNTNKNIPQHHSKLKSFKVDSYSQKYLFFDKDEKRYTGGYTTVILAETQKHYYYIDLSYDKENTEWFGIEIIYCMEKSAMSKFVDVRNVRKLKELGIIDTWIKNLSVTKSPKWQRYVWLFGSRLPEYLPHCSVLEVHYNKQRGCVLPDLVYCHPKIWDEYKSNLEKNEIERLEKKFEFHFKSSIRNPSNSSLFRLGPELKAVFNYLKRLRSNYSK